MIQQMTLFFFLCFFALACGAGTEQGNAASGKGSEGQAAEKPRSPEDKVAAADARFIELKKQMPSMRKERREFQNQEPELYYDYSNYIAYYEGETLRNLLEQGGEEGYSSQNNFYFDAKGELYLVHNRLSFMDNLFEERLYYVEDMKIYASLGRDKEAEDEKQDLLQLPLKKVKNELEVHMSLGEMLASTKKRFAAGEIPAEKELD